jgi:CPA2 family monovalent cation:H+ antiporter-2
MVLISYTIESNSPLVGKPVRESGLKEDFQCMLIGFEDNEEHLGLPYAARVFKDGDVVWIVGERTSLMNLIEIKK